MKIAITGSSSGVGLGLCSALCNHDLVKLSRAELDLSDTQAVINYSLEPVDMLINCAGTDIGGKIDFIHHRDQNVVSILNTNLLGPMLLTKKALLANSKCKIVNITSTNNNRYYQNNLAYSLSKLSLSSFGNMLSVDYPDVQLLEVRLGLTKTNFNNSRYSQEPNRFDDVYKNKHLTVDQVSQQIADVLFDNRIKFIEISP